VARDMLAAIYAFLVPSLFERMVAAVQEGGGVALGDAELSAEGMVLFPGAPRTPFASLRLAYRADLVSITSAEDPARTILLDPLLSWNVVLLPYFIAALSPRLP